MLELCQEFGSVVGLKVYNDKRKGNACCYVRFESFQDCLSMMQSNIMMDGEEVTNSDNYNWFNVNSKVVLKPEDLVSSDDDSDEESDEGSYDDDSY